MWSQVRYKPGVQYPLPKYPTDAPPKAIEESEIDRLRALETDGRALLKDTGMIRPGDRVMVLEGLFSGSRGRVERVRLDNLVKLILDNGVKADLSVEDLRPVD